MAPQEFASQAIVLGGGLTPEGYPTQETHDRTISAVHYSHDFGADKIIFSGGQGFLYRGEANYSTTEAEVMAELAVANGLDAENIHALDNKSRSTFETFLNVRPLIDPEPTAIITHAYHLPRSLFMARLNLDVPIEGVEAMAIYTKKAKPPLDERALTLATRIAMLGVQHGDSNELRRRNQVVERLVASPQLLSGLAHTILRRHPSVEAKRAN